MRTVLPRNNHWYFCPEFREEFTLLRVGKDFSQGHPRDFKTVRLPHNAFDIPYSHFDEKSFQKVCSYCHIISKEEQQPGSIHRLRFEGAMLHSRVYVNGIPVGEHSGGYTEFTVDITDSARGSEDLLVLVVLDSREREDIPPFGHVVDFLAYSGLYREVQLEILPPTFIDRVFPVPGNILGKKKNLDIHLNLAESEDISGAVICAELSPAAAPVSQALSEGSSPALPKGSSDDRNSGESETPAVLVFVEQPAVSGENTLRLEELDVSLWDVDDPVLYTLRVSLLKNTLCVDSTQVTFGFREACFTAEGFFLNGRRLQLRGLNRHQSFPYVGYAMPKGPQQRDADILKYELGVNIVRESHYPQSRHFLDRCDQIGLLVFSEIPGWQHIGEGVWQDNVLLSVEEMILRDRHRPSVIIWGVRINESPDCTELYRKTNELARHLDPSRQTGGVRNFRKSEFFEDVFTFNDFLHSGDNPGAERPVRIKGHRVPYLITEHNGHMFPTKKNDNEERRLNQAFRHLKVLQDSSRYKGCSGAIGWCLFDYNTHKDFGSGDGICHHGVLDMFRIPKTAAAAYSSQARGKVFGHVASEMRFGDRDAGLLGTVWVFTNSKEVRLYRNDLYIATFYPKKKDFSHIPYAPVKVDDFIGERIHREEPFREKDADVIKAFFLKTARREKISPLLYLRLGWVMLRNRISYRDGYSLYGKYVANWGTEAVEYRFEGYSRGEKQWSETKSTASPDRILLKADSTVLKEGETWDATRFTVALVNRHQQTAVYGSQIVQLTCQGPVEIIGPTLLALNHGSTGFWVKTTGGSGSAEIQASVEGFETVTILLEVR